MKILMKNSDPQKRTHHCINRLPASQRQCKHLHTKTSLRRQSRQCHRNHLYPERKIKNKYWHCFKNLFSKSLIIMIRILIDIFLLSFLPEMSKMTEKQNFEFRMEVMKALNKVKYQIPEQHTQSNWPHFSSPFSDSHRNSSNQYNPPTLVNRGYTTQAIWWNIEHCAAC